MIWKRRVQSASSEQQDEMAQGAAQPLPDTAANTAMQTIHAPDTANPTYPGGSTALEERPSFLDRLWAASTDQVRVDTLPRFTATASDEVEQSNDAQLVRRKIALRDAMGASQPVIDREHFAGRHDALRQLITAVEQQRMHVVVYGERGIGKTSLIHVFAETAREARYMVLYGSCGSDTRFETMFAAFASRIPRLYHKSVLPNSPEAESGDNFDAMLSPGFGPRELADLFADVAGTRVILVLDEYDRVADPQFRRDVAELIKNLSDRASRVQLVLAGVAQNLDEILGYAPSVRRNVVGLPLRPMSSAEVTDLIGIGEAAGEIEFTEAATRLVTVMAGGSPYLVRLLAHQAGLVALDARSAVVTDAHATTAVERVLTEWNASLPRRVQASLGREEARAQWPMLIAAARAGSAADGLFSVDDVITELGEARVPSIIERDLKGFSGPHDLLETQSKDGETHFRFRYPGVASLLLMSSAMARLSA